MDEKKKKWKKNGVKLKFHSTFYAIHQSRLYFDHHSNRKQHWNVKARFVSEISFCTVSVCRVFSFGDFLVLLAVHFNESLMKHNLLFFLDYILKCPPLSVKTMCVSTFVGHLVRSDKCSVKALKRTRLITTAYPTGQLAWTACTAYYCRKIKIICLLHK